MMLFPYDRSYIYSTFLIGRYFLDLSELVKPVTVRVKYLTIFLHRCVYPRSWCCLRNPIPACLIIAVILEIGYDEKSYIDLVLADSIMDLIAVSILIFSKIDRTVS